MYLSKSIKFYLLSTLLAGGLMFSGLFLIQNNSGGLLALIGSDTRLPYPPYGLQTSITSYNQINISWVDDSSNVGSSIPVTQFKVLRRQANIGAWSILSMANGSSYIDYDAIPGGYDYRIDACNDNGCSVNSNFVTISFSKDVVAPVKPDNFSVPQKEVADTKANLYWDGSTDDIGIKHYNIYRSIASANNFQVIASTSGTSFTDTSLAPITNYYYYIKAIDLAKNESPATSIASIITLSLGNAGSYVRIVSPNGGECFVLPGNLHLVWTGSNLNNSKLYYGGQLIFTGRDLVFDWYMTASVSPTTAGSVKVVAIDDSGAEGLSDSNDSPFTISLNCNKETPVPVSVPPIPTYFRASWVNNERDIALSWQDNSGNESEFRVFRRKLPDGNWQLISKVAPNIVNVIDTEVPPADYEYDANACNSVGCSAYSNRFQITAVATLSASEPGRIYSDSEIQQGDMVSAGGSSDPDIYIINEHGYKRLFLNPVIFSFYGHLGGFEMVKNIEASSRDKYETSGLFRNCENDDGKVYGIEIIGEDTGTLRWVNTSGEQAVQDDPDFFKKVFCINSAEFSWYTQGSAYTSVNQVPVYTR